MKTRVLAAGLVLVAVSLCLSALPVRGEDADQPVNKGVAADERRARIAARTTLKLYEWGVQRENWDGTRIVIDDIPDFYHRASNIPLEQPDPEPPPRRIDPDDFPSPVEKPVIYFECDREITFDLTLRFTVGDVTWIYPKANRRLDTSTMQWNKITVYPDSIKNSSRTLPTLHRAPKDHWAEYSRNGSTSTVVVNGQAERFLFYEGGNSDMPEVDISRNDKGEIIVRNYSCCPVHDLRFRTKVKDQWRAWYVLQIPAADGDAPHELKLTDGELVNIANLKLPATLRDEAKAAGLTLAQAEVFARCWHKQFMLDEGPVLTYRLDPVLLDENYELHLDLPAGVELETHRVGYKWVGGIDLDRQEELDKLALTAATEGRASDAAKKLLKAGMSGIGAVRRAMLNKDQPLKKRIELAQILKTMADGRS